MAKLIKVDGSIEDYPYEGDTLSLEEIQTAVGGYFTVAPLRDPSTMMLVNEEGLLLKMEPNIAASELAGQPIVGPVLVINRNEID